jgi:YD repeat-containing protein
MLALFALLAPGPARADSLALEATFDSVALPADPTTPRGPGGEWQVHEATGQLSLRVPFPLAALDGGPDPSLALVWESTRGEGDAGPGWQLTTERICRADGPWAPAGASVLLWTGAAAGGRMVPDGAGRWVAPQGPIGFFATEDHEAGDGQGWRLHTPDGHVRRFGVHPHARSGPDPMHRAGVACWWIESRSDAEDRTVAWVWQREAGEPDGGAVPAPWLEAVRWHTEGPRPREVALSWTPRHTLALERLGGWTHRHGRRLEAMHMRVVPATGAPRTLHRWTLQWEEDARGAARLVQIDARGEAGEPLPPHRFDWEAEPLPDPTRVPGGPARAPEADRASLVDVDGDAFPDLLLHEGGRWRWQRNREGDALEPPRDVPGLPRWEAGARWRIADLDGDGLRDLLWALGREVGWYRNASTVAGGAAFTWQGTLPLPPGLDWGADVQLVDLNGDRRMDILAWRRGGATVWQSTWPVEAAGLPSPTAPLRFETGQPLALPELDPEARPWVQDVDGDGLPDLVALRGAATAWQLRWWPLQPDGRFGPPRTLPVPPTWQAGVDVTTLQLLDVEGDGQVDLVSRQGSLLRVLPMDRSGVARPAAAWVAQAGPGAGALVADFDADGRLDLLVPGAEGWWRQPIPDPAMVRPRLVGHRVGEGARVHWTWHSWAEAARQARAAGVPWATGVPTPMAVLAAEVRSQPAGPDRWQTWLWQDPHWDPRAGTFAGFARTQRVQPAGASLRVEDSLWHVGTGEEPLGAGGLLGLTDAPAGVADLEGLRGQLRARSVRDSEGRVLVHERVGWQLLWRSDRRPMVVPAHTITGHVEGTRRADTIHAALDPAAWTPAPTEGPAPPVGWAREPLWTHVHRTHDARGRLLREQRRGPLPNAPPHAASGGQCTEWDWARPDRETGPWDRPAEERRLDADCTTVLQRTRWFWDGDALHGLALGHLTRGHLHRLARWLDTEDRWVDEERWIRGPWGEPLERRDALGHRTLWRWSPGSRGSRVAAEVRRLDAGARATGGVAALEAAHAWDHDRDLPVLHRAPWGGETRFRYDGWGRMVARWHPAEADGPSPTLTLAWGWTPEGLPWIERLQRQGWDAAAPVVRSRQLFDPWGAPLAAGTEAEDGRWHWQGWTVAGPDGHPARTFLPWVDTASPSPEGPPQTHPHHAQERDALHRPVAWTDPLGHRTLRWHGPLWTGEQQPADTTGEPAPPTWVRLDPWGRTVETLALWRGPDGGLRARQRGWSHDALDRIVRLDMQHRPHRRWRWDSLGRPLEVQDPDAGVHLRFWDDTGLLVAEENGEGDLRMHAHDALGRPLGIQHQRADESQPRTVFSMGWDTPDPALGIPVPGQAHWLGRAAWRRDGDREQHWVWGRTVGPIAHRWIDGDTALDELMAWDPLDRPVAHRTPSGWTVRRTWDAQGRLQRIGGVLEDTRWNDLGQLEARHLANGRVERWTRDALDRPLHWQVGDDSATELPVLGLRQQWNGRGHLQDVRVERSPLLPDHDGWHIAWDDLDRPRAQEAHDGTPVAAWRWDDAGMVDARVAAPGLPGFDGVVRAGPQDGLDPALTSPAQRPSRAQGWSWTWDGAGRPREVAGPAGTHRLTWDAGARPVAAEAVDTGATTHWVWDPFGGPVQARTHQAGRPDRRTTWLGPDMRWEREDADAWLRIDLHAGDHRIASVQLRAPRAAPAGPFPWAGLDGRTLPSLTERPGSGSADASAGLPRPGMPGLALGLVALAVAGRARGHGRRPFAPARAAWLVPLMMLACDSLEGGFGAGEGGAGEATADPAVLRIRYEHAPDGLTPWLETDAQGRVVAEQRVLADGLVEARREVEDSDPFSPRVFGHDRMHTLPWHQAPHRLYDPGCMLWLAPDPWALWNPRAGGVDDLLLAYVRGRTGLAWDPEGLSERTLWQMVTQPIDASLNAVMSGAHALGMLPDGAELAAAVRTCRNLARTAQSVSIASAAVNVYTHLQGDSFRSRDTLAGQVASAYGAVVSQGLALAVSMNPVGRVVTTVDNVASMVGLDIGVVESLGTGLEASALVTLGAVNLDTGSATDALLREQAASEALVPGMSASVSSWMADTTGGLARPRER